MRGRSVGGDLGTVRALVCDDEPLARRAIQEYLADVEWIEVEATASDGREALRLIHKLEPDLVFLDVRMPGLTGLQVLEALEHRPAIVFTTAHDEYAISAFEHGAVDYLVKPFGRDRLVRTLDRVRVRLIGEGGGVGARWPRRGPHPAPSPLRRRRGATVPVRTESIGHVEAVDGGVLIHAEGERFELDATLGELEQRLDGSDFVRVHRAHIVNLAHVASIQRYDERRLLVRLDDGTKIVASRGGSQALRALMD